MGKIFWENFFGRIFWQEFFERIFFLGGFFLGGNFWEEFFVYILKSAKVFEYGRNLFVCQDFGFC